MLQPMLCRLVHRIVINTVLTCPLESLYTGGGGGDAGGLGGGMGLGGMGLGGSGGGGLSS